ncbi:hypothetical protein SAMN05444166_2857 [Singulisphaera sp. GP187]|nr:hypothetical protein SAMN05444166_2857 [Singulisphaera sp. GP187]
MRIPRVQFTIGQILLIPALIGVLLGAGINLERRGSRLVDFEYPCLIMNEPLENPQKLMSFEEGLITLEDGRIFELVFDNGKLTHWDPALELQAETDGAFSVYNSVGLRYCGNRSRQKRPWICIPLFPRTVQKYYRQLAGRARLVKDSRPPSQGE